MMTQQLSSFPLHHLRTAKSSVGISHSAYDPYSWAPSHVLPWPVFQSLTLELHSFSGKRNKRQIDTHNTCPVMLVADYHFYDNVGGGSIAGTAKYMVSVPQKSLLCGPLSFTWLCVPCRLELSLGWMLFIVPQISEVDILIWDLKFKEYELLASLQCYVDLLTNSNLYFVQSQQLTIHSEPTDAGDGTHYNMQADTWDTSALLEVRVHSSYVCTCCHCHIFSLSVTPVNWNLLCIDLMVHSHCMWWCSVHAYYFSQWMTCWDLIQCIISSGLSHYEIVHDLQLPSFNFWMTFLMIWSFATNCFIKLSQTVSLEDVGDRILIMQ